MNNETKETVAAIPVDQFERLCDRVDSELAEAMSGVFAQKRTRLKAAAYVETLCRDDVPVKTCWDRAEAAGYWDVVAKMASEFLVCPEGDPWEPGIAVDETAQPKRERHRAGVGVRYAGFAGGKVNRVTSVASGLITPSASTGVGNELFLSKPEIARRKLAALRAPGVTFTWSAGDEVQGRSSELRKDHEGDGEAYAYSVPRDFMVDLPSRSAKSICQVERGPARTRCWG